MSEAEDMDVDAQLDQPAGDPQRAGVIDALLALPEDDAERSWQNLPPHALLAEAIKYRTAIRDVALHLRRLGAQDLPIPDTLLLLDHKLPLPLPHTAPPPSATLLPRPPSTSNLPLSSSLPQPPPAAPLPPDDPDDLSNLGEEGLDYTLASVDDVDPAEWQVPPHCIPIHANVTTFDWPSLYEHCQFDVVMMDPPWQLATANPTRGVALGYSQLTDDHISGLPVPQLQRAGGYLFVWVINAKYKWTLDLFDKWGYRLVDEVVWVKMTVNRRLAKSHGYYLQHAKEVCLVAKRGNPPGLAGGGGVGSDVIFSERRGQSQKPEEIYELVEQLVPNGRYLEIFARKNNLRNYWVSLGNEVTGTGLPEEDMRALREVNCIPGAVYGKTGGGGGGGGGGSGGGGAGVTRGASAGSSGPMQPGGRGAGGACEGTATTISGASSGGGGGSAGYTTATGGAGGRASGSVAGPSGAPPLPPRGGGGFTIRETSPAPSVCSGGSDTVGSGVTTSVVRQPIKVKLKIPRRPPAPAPPVPLLAGGQETPGTGGWDTVDQQEGGRGEGEGFAGAQGEEGGEARPPAAVEFGLGQEVPCGGLEVQYPGSGVDEAAAERDSGG